MFECVVSEDVFVLPRWPKYSPDYPVIDAELTKNMMLLARLCLYCLTTKLDPATRVRVISHPENHDSVLNMHAYACGLYTGFALDMFQRMLIDHATSSTETVLREVWGLVTDDQMDRFIDEMLDGSDSSNDGASLVNTPQTQTGVGEAAAAAVVDEEDSAQHDNMENIYNMFIDSWTQTPNHIKRYQEMDNGMWMDSFLRCVAAPVLKEFNAKLRNKKVSSLDALTRLAQHIQQSPINLAMS